MSLNPITSAFDIVQISAASTSISLSSSKLFNRVIASDDVQARGLIELCLRYEWMDIGVLYLTSNYGIYFMSKLNEYATFYGIKFHDNVSFTCELRTSVNTKTSHTLHTFTKF